MSESGKAISVEISQQQSEALQRRYPNLTDEQSMQLLIDKALDKRLSVFVKKGSVINFKKPDKG